ncbi:hypothetical protein VNO77_43903 [Canavalia gladiata]|uniref:Uncharacterized protein n=1 Tax=Canavalia gladiata TaxID=3824 RepID=A0AAN9PPV2_CANGL
MPSSSTPSSSSTSSSSSTLERLIEQKLKDRQQSSEADPLTLLSPPSPPSRHEKWKRTRQKASGEYTSEPSRIVAEKILKLQVDIAGSKEGRLASWCPVQILEGENYHIILTKLRGFYFLRAYLCPPCLPILNSHTRKSFLVQGVAWRLESKRAAPSALEEGSPLSIFSPKLGVYQPLSLGSQVLALHKGLGNRMVQAKISKARIRGSSGSSSLCPGQIEVMKSAKCHADSCYWVSFPWYDLIKFPSRLKNVRIGSWKTDGRSARAHHLHVLFHITKEYGSIAKQAKSLFGKTWEIRKD